MNVFLSHGLEGLWLKERQAENMDSGVHLQSQLVEVLKINETATHSRETEVEQSRGGVPENKSTQK